MNHARAPHDLRTSGLKATLPRMKVLEIFQRAGLHRHFSAEDVHKLLREGGSDVGLATIYRVLAQFEQAGLVKRGHFDAGKAVFELDGADHHDHLVCLHCGRVEEFVDPQIEQRQREVARALGFEIAGHAMSLFGVCSHPECAAAA